MKPLKSGIEIDSAPVDGTRCRFRTAYDFDLLPLELNDVELRREAPARLRLKFSGPEKTPLERLWKLTEPLARPGEATVTRALYVALMRHVRRVVIRRAADRPINRYELPPSAIKPSVSARTAFGGAAGTGSACAECRS
ncbi:MAG: type VI secretion system baseplate subunit TssF [Planctomycetota bacterium]